MNLRAMFPVIRFRIATISVAVACATVIFALGEITAAGELKVLYRNNTELTAQLSADYIDWVTVSKNGTLLEL